MKSRIYIIAAVLVALLIAIVWLLTRGKLPSPTPSVNAVPGNSAPQAGQGGATSPAGVKPGDSDAMARLAAFQAVWDQANGKSLEFYGRVIDQDGHPVTGAKVQGNVLRTEGFQGTSETPHFTQTDNDGNFEFRGLRGQHLGIMPGKEGYKFVQSGNGRWTDDYKADPTNRIVFHMWKIKGAELMIHVNLQVSIPCDGTAESFNLQTGHISPNGNGFTIKLTRNPVNIIRGKHFDWSVTFEMPNGGLIELTDLYPYEAPADGYQRSVTINMPANAPNWSSDVTKSYYFYDGKNYGRIVIDITADFQPPPTLFQSEIYMNPSGSRNLEYDPHNDVANH